ncbi:EAL domain-containing protein [Geodermatophilus sp. YIM 151500]|uniref:putative bifunctional diguanylate cyclase/phosphodiesterase n=1 Tax=Geodermatophilus sp. YIM 151500 TaxID=2984531 RepID=UPI0021E44DBB|nr:EAL domain-containing protein [Geodermatophilus sp. YIM 151500]MCV2491201.1 EAL domain-containing protein [Geodermatophilus sp. YIM 151500]
MHPDEHGARSAQPDPLAAVPDAVAHLDRSWRFTYLNASAERLLDRRAEDMLGRTLLECFPTAAGRSLARRLAQVVRHGEPRVFEHLHSHQQRWYELRAFPDPNGISVLFRDIDERRRREERHAAALHELAGVLEALPAPTVLVDHDLRILSANRAWHANGELLRREGKQPGQLGDDYLEAMALGLSPDDHAVLTAGLHRLLAGTPDGAHRTFDLDYEGRFGTTTFWFRLQASRVEGSDRVVVSHTDITERVRSEQALQWQAGHDELTGLPNRRRMLRLVDDALDEAAGRRDGRNSTALLHLDLDGFKTINDSLGHHIGDVLLAQVATRLLDQVRPGDAVGRLGADQFLVLARDCDSAEAAALAFRLQSSFALPFPAEGLSVPLSSSIGVAVAHLGTHDAQTLLGDADAAMYAAKSAGRDRVHLFSPGLREAARWRLEVATRLRDDAIDQLVVHYQPVVRLDTGLVEGLEALVRWQHPQRGLLLPDAFLSVAEETGQVIPITRRLLRETTAQAAAWAAEGMDLRMSVNVSARHFATETLVRDVRLALRDSGLAPEQLVLELTETSVAEDPTRAEDQLTVLRGIGVRIAIDDFGTGWSSLAQLFALPIGTLKIDRSLLAAAERAASGDTGAVLAAIVALTRTLGIRSVAEGVETVDHLRMVRAAGCDLAQGWLLGRPMPADEVPGWVRRVEAAGGDLCRIAEVAAASGAPAGGVRRPHGR